MNPVAVLNPDTAATSPMRSTPLITSSPTFKEPPNTCTQRIILSGFPGVPEPDKTSTPLTLADQPPEVMIWP